MRLRNSMLAWFWSALMMVVTPHLQAQSVLIANPSFEQGTTGWANGGGVFQVSPLNTALFLDPIPSGSHVLLLGGASPGPAFASQALGETVRANTT